MIDILARGCDGCGKILGSSEQIRLSFTNRYGEVVLCKRCLANLFVELKDYIYSQDELRHELLMIEDEYNVEW